MQVPINSENFVQICKEYFLLCNCTGWPIKMHPQLKWSLLKNYSMIFNATWQFYSNMCTFTYYMVPSVLWHCWLGGRKKGIHPVKNWVVGSWRGYLSGAMCRFAYGPPDAAATHGQRAVKRGVCVLITWFEWQLVTLSLREYFYYSVHNHELTLQFDR